MAEAQFPTTFADEHYQLGLGDVAPRHSISLSGLGKLGYVVEFGMMRQDTPAITEIAGQIGTQEYCRRDLEER